MINLGVPAGLGAAASWALGTVLFKGVGETVEPLVLTAAKTLFSVFALGAFLLIFGWQPITASSLGWLVLSGLLGVAAGDTLFFAALRRLTVHQLVILMMVSPGVTIILALIALGEKLSPILWLGIILILVGITVGLLPGLRQSDQGSSDLRGLMFGCLAMVCMAVSVIVAKLGVVDVSALEATFIRMLAGWVGVSSILVIQRRIATGLNSLATWRTALRFVLAATVVTFGGFWLTLVAIKWLEVSIANTLIATEPIFALPLAIFGLQERPKRLAWIGASIAFPGTLLIAFGHSS